MPPRRKRLGSYSLQSYSWLPSQLLLLMFRRRGRLCNDIGRNSAGRHKRIGEKLIGGKAAGSLEIPPCVADHQRVSTRINLRAGEIALIFQHRVMDQSRGSLPIGVRLRQHGSKCKPRCTRGPLRCKVCQIQVPTATATPVKMHRTFALAFDQVLDHRLEGRKAGPRRNADDWLFRVGPQMEIAVRKLNLELVALPQPDQHALRETASRQMTDMQLRTVAFVARPSPSRCWRRLDKIASGASAGR